MKPRTLDIIACISRPLYDKRSRSSLFIGLVTSVALMITFLVESVTNENKKEYSSYTIQEYIRKFGVERLDGTKVVCVMPEETVCSYEEKK